MLLGMYHLAKAQADGWTTGTGSPPRPSLEELLGPLFVHSIKADSLPIGELQPDRSSWLLKHLGSPSVAQPLTSFRAWLGLLTRSHSFDIREGEKDGEERSHLFGNMKTRIQELLTLICGA